MEQEKEENRYNIPPQLWGPKMWDSLMYIAFAFPKTPTSYDKQNFKNFIEALKSLLPCEKCRAHFDENMRKYPVDEYLVGPDELMEWITLIRFQVVKAKNKNMEGVEFDSSVPLNEISRIKNEIIRLYYQYKYGTFVKLFMIILFGFVGFLIYKNYSKIKKVLS